MTNEQRELMNKIQAYGFALVEANLYLDSHPTCPNGLEYFRKYKEKYETVKAEYERKYGPLTAAASAGTKKWEWVTEPFPWELSANKGGND